MNSTSSIENEFFKVTVGQQGQIVSFYDKKAKREIVSEEAKTPFGSMTVRVRPNAKSSGFFDVDAHPIAIGKARVEVQTGPITNRITIERSGDLVPKTEIILDKLD